jgi:hypothetical protein
MKIPDSDERRRMQRRNINYYLPVKDNKTLKIIGHLVDISPAGLLMDSQVPVPTNQRYQLHLDLMENLGGKTSLNFSARSIWCHPDPIQPFMYYAGFEISNLAQGDLEVIKVIANKYGAH